jgi:hypothetical protein
MKRYFTPSHHGKRVNISGLYQENQMQKKDMTVLWVL